MSDLFWDEKQCINGESYHVLKEKEKWTGKRWQRWEYCARCDNKLEISVKGCDASKDKQHRFKKGSEITDDGIAVNTKQCTACKLKLSDPI